MHIETQIYFFFILFAHEILRNEQLMMFITSLHMKKMLQ